MTAAGAPYLRAKSSPAEMVCQELRRGAGTARGSGSEWDVAGQMSVDASRNVTITAGGREEHGESPARLQSTRPAQIGSSTIMSLLPRRHFWTEHSWDGQCGDGARQQSSAYRP
jgi:hypothetical protein